MCNCAALQAAIERADTFIMAQGVIIKAQTEILREIALQHPAHERIREMEALLKKWSTPVVIE